MFCGNEILQASGQIFSYEDQLGISCSFVMIFAGGQGKYPAKAVYGKLIRKSLQKS
jgi:hypothetical protein